MTQNTWQYQGRQEHGWFGDGSAPASDKAGRVTSASAATIAQRIHDVGHTLVAGLPASKRYHSTAKLSTEDHARLDRLLTATVQALPMGGPAVARHVFGVKPNTPGIDGFVRAARLLRDGPESADMRAATDAVGRAAQDIGLDRFKSFLQSSDDHLQARGGLITLARYLPDPSARLTNIPGLPVPTRLPWGPLIVGLVAQALPMVADLARREDVSDTIKRFGLNPFKPADVTAAYAYLWAEDHGPWLFDTPQTGPEMQEMAERVMRAARADPALFGRAVGGDDDAQREFSAAVAPPVPGSGIETRSDEERALVSQMMSAGRNGSDIQTALDSLRGAGKGPTAEDRRNTPGVAMISTPLPHIEGPWLAARNSDDGAPIPAQVAKKLVGQRFASFGDLRAAIWKEVAGTPELAREFSDRSLKLMRDGNAPRRIVSRSSYAARGNSVSDHGNCIMIRVSDVAGQFMISATSAWLRRGSTISLKAEESRNDTY